MVQVELIATAMPNQMSGSQRRGPQLIQRGNLMTLVFSIATMAATIGALSYR
jgi:hypothetical protein